MKKLYIFSLTLLVCLISESNLWSQVGIGMVGPLDDGAILQIESNNQGTMIPNVALTSRNDLSTIDPFPVEGLLVYNTVTNGSGVAAVNPGFYYFDGSEWVRIYKDGYSVHYQQTNAIRANNQTTSYTFPNLDQTITAPYTGVYQIIVTAYYASASADSTSDEATGYCSVWLEINGVKAEETFITSNTKLTPSQFQALAQQGVIIHQVTLEEGTSYNFRVRAREWAQYNMDRGSLGVVAPGNWGFWGARTDIYNGNSTSYDFGQKGTMTITLLRQY